MNHFPIFLALEGRRVVLSGGGEAAVAKLRLLLKSSAQITVFASDAHDQIHGQIHDQIQTWARAGRLTLIPRAFGAGDAAGAVVFYAANEDAQEDARTSALARTDGALANIVDNLSDSDFITPAIVDRDPVTVAIGTEGTAPVLARQIKADLETRLHPQLGTLARIAKGVRSLAEALPFGRARRDFWSEYFTSVGPDALAQGEPSAKDALHDLLRRHQSGAAAPGPMPGHVDFVGAGPGDPELLTLKARKALDRADVVIHDRLISPEILELARREAQILDVGKTGFGPATPQSRINALLVQHAQDGAHVVRLKSGDATIFGRLDEEIEALEARALPWKIIPGITAASAGVAAIGQSLTRRGRNASVRFLTGHDMKGFADHDWRALAGPGQVAAIYMGKKAARFSQGRLLMHGADPATPVTLIENISRPDQRILPTTLTDLPRDLAHARMPGPALVFYGLTPRAAQTAARAIDIPAQELA